MRPVELTKDWWLWIPGFLLACASWGIWIEPGQLVVKDVELAVPGWPRAQDGLKIALLSDLHVGSPGNGLENLARIVRRANKAKPDAIFLLGDYVIEKLPGGRFVPPETSAAELSKLAARYGVYGVLGNHDHWLGARRVAAALERAGVTLLEDEAIAIEGQPLWFAGVSDFSEGRHDVAKALRGIPASASVVVLTHSPDIFPDVPSRVSLTVAGHTHGGQVRFPVFGSPYVPSKYGQRYALGHVVEDGRHLFVTSGIGTSILPVRLGVPPEIVILKVRSAEPNETRS